MKNFCKSSLVVFLVLALGMLMLPTIALADEASGDLLAEVQADMDAILEDYYIEVGMAEDEIAYVIQTADYSGKANPMDAINALEQKAAGLTEDELAQLQDYESTATFVAFYDVLDQMMTPMAATTVKVLDGKVSVTDNANSNTVSNGTVTITAKGSLFSQKTNKITIINETDNRANLKFDYTTSSASSFQIADATAAASGSYSVVLDAGASVSITLVSNKGLSNTTATLILSNFSLVAAAAASDVTFEYDSALGSVTVNGTAVSSGETQNITLADGAALVATPQSGAKFLGWIDGDNTVLSQNSTYILNPAADMTVTAVFAKDGGKPWFAVGGAAQKSVSSGLLGMSKLYYYEVGSTSLYDDLNAAATAAANKAVVLMNSGTLSAGEYTIPAGVTLLIPFDNANTMYKDQVQNIGTYTAPTAFRTLTMADGANLTINGAMSISAKQKYAAGSKDDGGAPTGSYGCVNMVGNSNITVNNGGVLYAYGFITGSGSVTANSGAAVYEMFQIADFRGGTQSTDMDNGVFPLSQYYVQNIEVPLTLYSGAKEYAYTTIYMSSTDFASAVAFISDSGAMFNLTDGYVVKRYDGAKDRLMVDAYGDLTLSSINMSVGTSSINSKNYELPINSNITVNIHSGTITINQDIAMLPGSEIIIGEGAKCTLGSGNNVYIYDADQWGKFASPNNKTFIPVKYAPGKTYTRTDADLKDAKIQVNGTMDASAGCAYTTAGGADIYSTGGGVVKVQAGTQTTTHQLVQGTGYTEIPITPAKLKNADGTYVGTDKAGTYNYVGGRWTFDCGDGNHSWTDATCTAPKTCSVCNATEGEALGHSWTDATCTAPKTCSACGATEGEALGHSWTDATCTAPKTCSVCGATEGEALGHSWTDADCDTPKTCSVCGATDGEALGHSFTGAIKSDGNGKGDTHSYLCVNGCGTYGDPAPHSWNEGKESTPATCTTDGEITYTCTVPGCGAAYTETAAAKGHSFGDITPASDATCEKAGNVAYKQCQQCSLYFAENAAANAADGKADEASFATPMKSHSFTGDYKDNKDDTHSQQCVNGCNEYGNATAHTWGEGEVTDEPDCLTAGTKEFKCVCDATKTETIVANGHKFGAVIEANAATCEAAGNEAYKQCQTCNLYFAEDADKTAENGLATNESFVISSLGHSFTGEIKSDGDGKDATHSYLCVNGCGTYGNAAPHSWNDGEETTPATCTDKGVKTYTCTVDGCGGTYTEDIPALQHNYTAEVTTEPNCTEPGVRTYTCQNDNSHTYTEEIKANGHSYGEWYVSDNATCTEQGQERRDCAKCKHYETRTINANGHTDENGDYYCDVESCKALLCTNHSFTGEETTPATCTNTGIMTYTCPECKHSYTEPIAAKGHTFTLIAANAATCETAGNEAHYQCETCKLYFADNTDKFAAGLQDDKDFVIGELDHSFTNYASDGNATCTADGTKTAKCDRCDATDTVADEGSKLGHSFTNYVSDGNATCTADGTKTAKCDRCDVTDTAADEGSKLDHSFTNYVSDGNATCTADGTKTAKCDGCDVTETVADEGSKLDHSFTNYVSDGNATCTADGTKTAKCDRCDVTDTAADEGSKLDHSFTNYVSDGNATCTADGTKTAKCDGCDVTETVADEGSKLDHSFTNYVSDGNATCTADGTKTAKCDRCDVTDTAADEGSKLDHSFTNYVSDGNATCTADGTKTAKCDGCDETDTVADEGSKLDHSFTNYVSDGNATCTEDGTKTAKCDRCDVTDTAADEGSALGHTEITVERQEPTCTEPGHEAGVKCEVCGNVLSGMTEITAPGHDLLQYEAKEPTCAEVGWDAYEECQREGCDYTTYKERPTADHDWVKYDAKAPTYTEDGYDAHKVCTVCGTSEPENYEIYPALGVPTVDDYDEFVFNLQLLEQLAEAYVQENPGKDPVALVIKYIRTGVDRYNSGSWGIMAGYEDTDFANFVRRMENQINAGGGYDFDGNGENELMAVTAMKNIVDFTLPNGDTVDFGHMFGTMDITYHNTGSQNHADVGGWAGDLVDLMTAADRAYTSSADSSVKLDPNVDLETMTQQIRDEIFLKTTCADDKFALTDWYGDIDAMYVMNSLYAEDDYTVGMMADIISGYCTENLDDVDRAEYFLKQRLDNPGTRAQVRAAVYEAYCDNKTITTLEATRDFGNTDAKYLEQLRRASCYAFADYICRLAGDWVEISENPYYTDFSSETSVLAPGITQEIHKATSADNKQMVYYLAIADLTNSKVTVNANYNENDPSEWKMARVLDQANAAQDKYGDPNSEHYIPNYQVVAAINADGFNMSTGEPGGLLVMDGKEWHPANSNGFFGITKEGKPVIGTTKEYNSIYKGQLRDAVAAFGTTLVKDGKISITASSDYYTNRASRTAVGITKTGKVVFMVLDGRQEPVSCGGSMEEIAQIMLEAGCEIAINLDGGGSTTFVSKPEGSDALQVTSKPSDGYARSVSSTLIMVSTAPSSTAFDHAILNSDYDYATIGTAVTMTPVGVSATGNVAELPEGYTWAVSNDKWGTVTQDGIFTGLPTGLPTGDVEVMLMLDDKVIGSKTINIVTPASVYFTRSTIDAVYGQTITLPVAALYEGKPVAISEDDVTLTAAVNAGTISGFKFTAAEESNIRNFKITAALKADADVNGSITVNLYKQGENTFDFEKATAGDRQLAWSREVSNSTTDDAMTYTAIARDGDMVTSYIFAMDMTQIPIPTNLEDLVYMLPGADAANASAWNFLLQLAERVSVLTEVTPVIDFDDRFEVDYSELKILNEYFKLQENGVTFDESTNTLTMTLNWVDQTKAIDAATANPLCLVSGIKLTPKDAAFVNDRFTAVNSGEIGYKIYLRANALYSFSQKPENQQKYGLKPFTNRYTDANGETKDESGGYMQNVYKNFEDTYTLSYAEKQGWVRESGGYAYYKDGAKLTGVKQVDGYYYDFGTKGINIGQTKYTGIFAENSKNYCAKLGEIVYSDWTLIDGEMWHSNANGVAHKAEKRGSMTCTRGGYASYECDACNVSQKLGDYVMPSGHDWDVNHVCKTCGYKGKDIAKATIGFGTISKPIAVTPVPKYYYQSGGVRPVTYLTFDGRNALTKSSDATLNSDGTMRDVFVSWTNGTGIGKAVVHFAGKGNYYGTATLDYIIVPCDVTTLKTSAVSAEAVTLTWTAPAGARTYTIYKDVDGKYEAIAENVSGTSYTVTGLEAGVKYKFAVKGSAPSTDGENVQYYSAKYSNTVTVLDGKATVQSSTSGGGAISGGGGAAGGGGGGAAGGGAAVPEGATASSVTSMIDKLGNITLADKETLAEIREAYDSLTTSQRLKVENYEALLAAEEKLAELEKAQQTDTVTTAVFEDVKEEHWFHNNVYDAYGRGLMKGTSDTEFEPQQSLSRAMLVTILYRLESEPAISGTNDFGDVKDGLWYSDAITWAAANEIVNGMGEGIFAPNQNVSREQTAAILMRYSQYKGYDVTNDGDLSRYLDAHMVSAWAEDYMEWANHTGLIAGDAAGRLNPQGNATRAEAATILIRYIDNIAS